MDIPGTRSKQKKDKTSNKVLKKVQRTFLEHGGSFQKILQIRRRHSWKWTQKKRNQKIGESPFFKNPKKDKKKKITRVFQF
jgi:hypothetical protein